MDCPSEPIELKETMLRIGIIIGSTRPGRNGEAVAKKLNADVGVSEAEKQAASAREHGLDVIQAFIS